VCWGAVGRQNLVRLKLKQIPPYKRQRKAQVVESLPLFSGSVICVSSPSKLLVIFVTLAVRLHAATEK
jgi:hypothetical protein